MIRSRRGTRFIPLLAFAVLAAAIGAPAPTADAQYDVLEDWWTYANGDEIITVEVNPSDPDEVWVGTEGGGVIVWTLDRSGDEVTGDFRQYLFPNEPGLASNTVYDIAFDPGSDDVWLATSLGLTHVSGASWEFVDVSDALLGIDVLSAVAVDSEGVVWVGTPGNGLAMRDTFGDWQFIDAEDLAFDDEEPREGPGSLNISDIAVDNENRVWVVHGRRGFDTPVASIFDPGLDSPDGQWRHIVSGGPRAEVDKKTLEVEAPRTSSIMAVAVDDETGDVWLASWSRGAYRLSDGRWYEYSEAASKDADASLGITPPCSDTLWAIDAHGGDAWVACGGGTARGAGVAAWDGGDSWSLVTLSHGLPTNVVTSVAIGEGWTYLGTDSTTLGNVFGGNGIVPVRFDTLGKSDISPELMTEGISPHANEITAMIFDPSGRLWAGTRGAGLLRWEGEGSEWERFTFDSTSRDLAGDTITDFALRGDELWISATSVVRAGRTHVDGGVSVYDLTSDSWVATHRPVPFSTENGQISSLAVLGDGRVAMGIGMASHGVGLYSQAGKGVAIYEPEGDVWDYHDFELTGGDLSGDTIADLQSDGQDLWAAVSYFADPANDLNKTGGGVSRMDGDFWTSWGDGDDGLVSLRDSLITGDVRSILVDSIGDVWAGTYESDSIASGWPAVDAIVNRWSRETGDWEAQSFGTEGWVPALAEDTNGVIWVGTTRGHSQEFFPSVGAKSVSSVTDGKKIDQFEGGVFVRDDLDWLRLTPRDSGLAFKAIRSMAVEPATGHVWVGGESGGFSVYRVGVPAGPTRTPRPTNTAGPSPTPGPTDTPGPTSVPATVTPGPTNTPLPVPSPDDGNGNVVPIDATRSPVPGEEDATPVPAIDEPNPPPEVPELGTWMLLLLGLGGIWWWAKRRTRPVMSAS